MLLGSRSSSLPPNLTGADASTGTGYAGTMPTDVHTSPWICDTCKKPITDGDGVIELVNNNPAHGQVGSLARRASDDSDLMADPNVKAVVFHTGKKGCQPYPGLQGYPILVSRAGTLADWVAWMNHLFEKSWLSRGDLERLNRLWFKNRGIDIHRFGA